MSKVTAAEAVADTPFEPVDALDGLDHTLAEAAVETAEEMVAHLAEHGAAGHEAFVWRRLNPVTHRPEFVLQVGREPDGPVSSNVLYWLYAVPLAAGHPAVEFEGETLSADDVRHAGQNTTIPESEGPDWLYVGDDEDSTDATETEEA